jgi:hypothetical protein
MKRCSVQCFSNGKQSRNLHRSACSYAEYGLDFDLESGGGTSRLELAIARLELAAEGKQVQCP